VSHFLTPAALCVARRSPCVARRRRCATGGRSSELALGYGGQRGSLVVPLPVKLEQLVSLPLSLVSLPLSLVSLPLSLVSLLRARLPGRTPRLSLSLSLSLSRSRSLSIPLSPAWETSKSNPSRLWKVPKKIAIMDALETVKQYRSMVMDAESVRGPRPRPPVIENS
jgi:hypothetical protein